MNYAFLIDEFGTYTGWNKVWILFPIALLVILLLAKKEDKKIFAGVFLVQMLTVFNPLVADFLVSKIGFESRYRRVMWTVVFYVVIGYALTLLIARLKARILRYVLFLCSVCLVVGLGTPVFNTSKAGAEYRMVMNKDFTDPEIREIAKIFHQEGKERPVVLYEDLFSRYRLYDPSVISVMTRNAMLDAAGNTWEKFKKKRFISSSLKQICRVYLYRDYSELPDEFYEHLKENEVDYIVAHYPELDNYLSRDPEHFSILGSTASRRVWKVL